MMATINKSAKPNHLRLHSGPESILAGTKAIYDFSHFVIKTIISRHFGILRICQFHLRLNQILFLPVLTYQTRPIMTFTKFT